MHKVEFYIHIKLILIKNVNPFLTYIFFESYFFQITAPIFENKLLGKITTETKYKLNSSVSSIVHKNSSSLIITDFKWFTIIFLRFKIVKQK